MGLLLLSQTWFIIMSTMVQNGIVIGIVSICKSMMVNHVYFNVYNIFLRVYKHWVYNISASDLILFPWVHNPLGY